MASEVHQAPYSVGSTAFPATPNDSVLADFAPEDLQKIIDFRDAVLTGKHPRFKPSPGAATSSERPKPSSAALGPCASEKAKLPPRPPPPGGPSRKQDRQIDDVLLTKSDVLVRAEAQLKRERIEKELKQQVEQKKIDMRLGIEVRNGVAVGEEEVDLEEAMEKAGIRLRPIERPEDPTSVGKLVGFYGDAQEEQAERRKEMDHYESQQKFSSPPTGLTTQNGHPPPPLAPVRMPSRNGETTSERGREHEKSIPPPKEPRIPASDSLRRAAMDGASSQAADQPRYVATASGVRSPAAPQPIRPANMARVESQDHIVELDASSADGFTASRGRSPVLGRSGRNTPQEYIKPEPISPYRKELPTRRPGSPGLDVYRAQPPPHFDPRAPAQLPRFYEYDVPPGGYAPPAPHPPPPRYPPYDSYGYREASYAPPPDYRRPYAPYGPPPVAAYYPPPRGPYDEYERYGSRPPPPPPPPPPQMPRRSPSPGQPHANKRPRRSSRSMSPGRRPRQTPARSPSPGDRANRSDRGYSGPPLPPAAGRRDERPTYDRAPPPRVDPYAHPEYPPYAPPPSRPYYDARDPYYPPPPIAHARYVEEALAPRPESAMIPREGDFRSYRERDPYPPPPSARLPPGPPPPSSGYPAARPDYRAPSRALMGPPDMPEYPPPPPAAAPRDYYGRPMHPHDPAEYGRGGSARPPDERAYLPPREQSARPDLPQPPGPPGYYGEAGYRAPSVRPVMAEKDGRYDGPPQPMGHPPPPPPPPQGYPGYDDYRGRY